MTEESQRNPSPAEPGSRKLISAIALAMVSVTVGWLIWVMLHPFTGAHIEGRTTDHPVLIFSPGRASYAFHLFFVLAAAFPSICLASILWLPDPDREKRISLMPPANRDLTRKLQKWLTAIFAALTCLVFVLAGWSVEALKTEVRLTPETLIVRNGNRSAQLPWSQVNSMVLDLKSFRQSMAVGDETLTLKIDLGALNVPDRGLLIKQVSRIAQMRMVRQLNSNLVVYKKIKSASPNGLNDQK